MDKKEITWILSVCLFLLTQNENTSGEKKAGTWQRGPGWHHEVTLFVQRSKRELLRRPINWRNGMNGPQSSNHIPEAENSDG